MGPFWDVFVAHRGAGRGATPVQDAAPAHEPASFENTFVNRRGEATGDRVVDGAALRRRRATSATSSAAASTSPCVSAASWSWPRSANFLRTSRTPPRACSSSSTTTATVVGNSVNRELRAHDRLDGARDARAQASSSLLRAEEDADLGPTRHRLRASRAPNPKSTISHWRTRDGSERIIAWTATPIVDVTGTELGAHLRGRRHRARAARGGSPNRARSACGRRSRLHRSRSSSTPSTTRSPAGTRRGADLRLDGRGGDRREGHDTSRRVARPSSPSSSGAFAPARSIWASRARGCARTALDVDVAISAAPIRDVDRHRRQPHGALRRHHRAQAPGGGAAGLARPDRGGRRRGAAAARAQPPRRRAAAARRPLPLAAARPVEGGHRSGRSGCDSRKRSRRARRRARRAPRARARDPPGRAHGPRPGGGRRGARHSLARPGRVRDAGGGAAARGRGRRLLRDRRGAGERDQVRAAQPPSTCGSRARTAGRS